MYLSKPWKYFNQNRYAIVLIDEFNNYSKSTFSQAINHVYDTKMQTKRYRNGDSVSRAPFIPIIMCSNCAPKRDIISDFDFQRLSVVKVCANSKDFDCYTKPLRFIKSFETADEQFTLQEMISHSFIQSEF